MTYATPAGCASPALCRSRASCANSHQAYVKRASKRMLTLCKYSVACVLFICAALPTAALADKLHLTDGTTIEADEAWDDPQGVWYRRGGITNFIERARVRKIEHEQRTQDGDAPKRAQTAQLT